MLLPFIAWTITGIFFFFKPGYKEAYQVLSIKTYPIDRIITLPEGRRWLEVRQLKTLLGPHLLVKDNKGWQQLDINSYQILPKASEQQITQLVSQAIADDKARYGDILSIEGNVIETTTGVRITLNWPELSLRQQGKDTDFINTLYNIHYLRWTGIKSVDHYLGVIGLLAVSLLAVIGTWMTVMRKKQA